jgi:hypothetical protein
MVLTPKVELKMKFGIQTIVKSIQTPVSIGIQIFGSLLLEIYFSWQEGVARSLLAEFHKIPKFQEFLVNF